MQLDVEPNNQPNNWKWLYSKAKNDCKFLDKHKNNYNHRQRRMRSGTDMSFGLGAKGLKPAKGLEPITKPNVQKVDVGR